MTNNRGLKNRVAISNAVDKELWYSLKELAKKTRIPMSKLIDEAIYDLLKKYNKQPLTTR